VSSSEVGRNQYTVWHKETGEMVRQRNGSYHFYHPYSNDEHDTHVSHDVKE